jgi:23S rRNA (uracil1939-C5)-methyltransferase
VFVPFVLPGERVEAKIVEEKKSFVRALPEMLLQPAPERVEAQCRYFQRCGGCHYQHAVYEYQLQSKAAILSDTLRRIGRLEVPPIQVHPSPPWHYRNRTRMKVQSGSLPPRPAEQDNTGIAEASGFILGYFRAGSHDLLPVEDCPISSPLINRAIKAVWELGRIGLVSEALVEIEFFADAADAQLLLELILPDRYWTLPSKPSLPKFVTALRNLVPEICGVAVFRTEPLNSAQGRSRKAGNHREALPKGMRAVFGAEELICEVGDHKYRVSAGSFFQANRYLTSTLIEIVTAGHSGQAALDLYAGTGLFTLPLAQTFHDVTAVEAGPLPFYDLKRNSPPNAKTICANTEDFLGSSGQHRNTRFDLVVVDPPRAGLGEETAAQLGRLHTPRIAYVSCDPATLARDLKVLLAAGFHLEKIDLVDLFPQTFHIETVAHLVR